MRSLDDNDVTMDMTTVNSKNKDKLIGRTINVILVMVFSVFLFVGISFAKSGAGSQGNCQDMFVRDGNAGMIMSGGIMGGGTMLEMTKWWQNPEIAKRLALTEAEKTTLNNLYVEKMKNMIDDKAGQQKNLLLMQQLFEAENFDDTRALSMFKEHQDLITAVATEQFKFIIEVRKLIGVNRFKELKSVFDCYRIYSKGKGTSRGTSKGIFNK